MYVILSALVVELRSCAFSSALHLAAKAGAVDMSKVSLQDLDKADKLESSGVVRFRSCNHYSPLPVGACYT